MFDHKKYQRPQKIALSQRQWPNKQIDAAPLWCSVDLRDGNQALIEPMNVDQKIEMFDLLVDLGFKQIEIGFPSASQTDFDFTRYLIEENKIPDDVQVQVLVQAREHLIARTYEALIGVKQAIVHVYNSTSTIQRERVFDKTKHEIKAMAVAGANWVLDYAKKYPQTDWSFQYSPESFTQTETDYAVSVCNAVIDVWQAHTSNKIIINLPATVEVSMPNEFADQIEWFCQQVIHRDQLLISVHTHNDRGCGVAAAEMAVLAGADRVEGTLFGNGERTGNMDIITMAMNLYSQGVDPKLDLSDVERMQKVYKNCTHLPISPRHPWVGELVYTAFSGSHQDAIKKSMAVQQPDEPWQVAYLPIDPTDLGRSFEEIIVVNSQSGKGGISWMLQQHYGIELPRAMLMQFSKIVQKYTDTHQCVADKDSIWQLFETAYLANHWMIDDLRLTNSKGQDQLVVHGQLNQLPFAIAAQGQGVLNTWLQALNERHDTDINVVNLNQYSQQAGSDSKAVAIIEAMVQGEIRYAVGIDKDTAKAPLMAACALVNID
jgi:2-isopropylmalate synthase